MFLVTADQSWTMTPDIWLIPQYRNTSTLGCWWLSFYELQAVQNISIGLRSRLWLDHPKILTLFFFNHSLVKRLVYLGLLSCCMTRFLLRFSSWKVVLTYSFRFAWYHSEFIVTSMRASRSGLDAVKQVQTMILSPLCYTDKVLMLECSVFFPPNITLLI